MKTEKRLISMLMAFLYFDCIHVKCFFVAMKKRFKAQMLDVALPGLIRNPVCVLISKHIKGGDSSVVRAPDS